ncbi:unnamed protein product [Durusdinium trenchii]|uniref:Uncharacterized protein n=1 Tax=Durusdinium trenchii TaxID=1381693 RepID=A0ABP0NQ46_9DINO
MAAMVIRVLLVSFVMASATPRLSPCVPAEGSCNPSLDRCCQGPGLMTCRLRSNTKDAGMSYKCGAEFTHQAVSQPKCIPEGDFCDTDSRTCCQLEDKMPLKCIKPEHEKADSTGEVRPKCLAEAETFSVEACVEEGSSCSPLQNRCCQGQERSFQQALRTCQLRFSVRPGVHSPAYICSKEFVEVNDPVVP